MFLLIACGGFLSSNGDTSTASEKVLSPYASSQNSKVASTSKASTEVTFELLEKEKLRSTLKDKYDVGEPAPFIRDATGKWRIVKIANGTPPADYAVDYARAYMNEGDIHFVVNFFLNTTTMFRQSLGVIEAKTTEYVDGEEHDASTIGEGLLLDDVLFEILTGKQITADADSDAGTADSDEMIMAVKNAIQGSVGSGESITDVTFDVSNLTVFVDLSGADTSILSIDDIAEIRISSITDSILDLDDAYYNTWETITLDYGFQGKAVFDKSMVVDQGLGKYFDYPIGIIKK
jgi:hypothetical protein